GQDAALRDHSHAATGCLIARERDVAERRQRNRIGSYRFDDHIAGAADIDVVAHRRGVYRDITSLKYVGAAATRFGGVDGESLAGASASRSLNECGGGANVTITCVREINVVTSKCAGGPNHSVMASSSTYRRQSNGADLIQSNTLHVTSQRNSAVVGA